MRGLLERTEQATRRHVRSRRAFLVTFVGSAAWVIGAAALERAAKSSARVPPDSVAGIAIPSTAVARAALDLAAGASPDFLLNHCVRTFLFGALISQLHGVRYDAEVAFIAAALHDLGLIERYSSKDEPFEIDGADAAKRFLSQRGFPNARIEIIWDAIAMHTSALSGHKGPEVALVGSGAKVSIVGRNPDRVRSLARACGAESLLRDQMNGRKFDALVHATPLGMFPHPDACFFPGAIPASLVFDMVYNPLETTLLRHAASQGLTVISGLQMFLEQATRQFEIWTGATAPRTVMEKAAIEALTPSC